MRAHLMITELCTWQGVHSVISLPASLSGLSFQIMGRLFMRNYLHHSFRIYTKHTWKWLTVKIRPKKILQSTILQSHLIKHSLARNPELQNDLFSWRYAWLYKFWRINTSYEAVDCYAWRWHCVCENSICTWVGSGHVMVKTSLAFSSQWLTMVECPVQPNSDKNSWRFNMSLIPALWSGLARWG